MEQQKTDGLSISPMLRFALWITDVIAFVSLGIFFGGIGFIWGDVLFGIAGGLLFGLVTFVVAGVVTVKVVHAIARKLAG